MVKAFHRGPPGRVADLSPGTVTAETRGITGTVTAKTRGITGADTAVTRGVTGAGDPVALVEEDALLAGPGVPTVLLEEVGHHTSIKEEMDHHPGRPHPLLAVGIRGNRNPGPLLLRPDAPLTLGIRNGVTLN
jgi:hypothetical protein